LRVSPWCRTHLHDTIAKQHAEMAAPSERARCDAMVAIHAVLKR
jgi:hypothetical protein